LEWIDYGYDENVLRRSNL